jgi:hypothetical protein
MKSQCFEKWIFFCLSVCLLLPAHSLVTYTYVLTYIHTPYMHMIYHDPRQITITERVDPVICDEQERHKLLSTDCLVV